MKYFIRKYWLGVVVVLIILVGTLGYVGMNHYYHSRVTTTMAKEYSEEILKLYGYDMDETNITRFVMTTKNISDDLVKIDAECTLDVNGKQCQEKLQFYYDKAGNEYRMSEDGMSLEKDPFDFISLLEFILCLLIISVPLLLLGGLLIHKNRQGMNFKWREMILLPLLMYGFILLMCFPQNVLMSMGLHTLRDYAFCGVKELFGVSILCIVIHAVMEELVKFVVPFLVKKGYGKVMGTKAFMVYGLLSAVVFTLMEQLQKMDNVASYNRWSLVVTLLFLIPSHMMFTSISFAGYAKYRKTDKLRYSILGLCLAGIFHTLHNLMFQTIVVFFDSSYALVLQIVLGILYYSLTTWLVIRICKKGAVALEIEKS